MGLQCFDLSFVERIGLIRTQVFKAFEIEIVPFPDYSGIESCLRFLSQVGRDKSSSRGKMAGFQVKTRWTAVGGTNC